MGLVPLCRTHRPCRLFGPDRTEDRTETSSLSSTTTLFTVVVSVPCGVRWLTHLLENSDLPWLRALVSDSSLLGPLLSLLHRPGISSPPRLLRGFAARFASAVCVRQAVPCLQFNDVGRMSGNRCEVAPAILIKSEDVARKGFPNFDASGT